MRCKMSKLIYVIDDEMEICELLKIALEARDYKVQVGYDGESAIKMVKKKKPDLLIIDLKMPRMNGYEVIAHLKSQTETADLPIMVMTSLTQGSRKSDDEWKKSLNVVAFLTKPFEPIQVVNLVQKVFDAANEK